MYEMNSTVGLVNYCTVFGVEFVSLFQLPFLNISEIIVPATLIHVFQTGNQNSRNSVDLLQEIIAEFL